MTTKSSLIRLLRASRNPHSDPEQMRLITFGRPSRRSLGQGIAGSTFRRRAFWTQQGE